MSEVMRSLIEYEINGWGWAAIVRGVKRDGYFLLQSSGTSPDANTIPTIQAVIEKRASEFGITHCMLSDKHVLFLQKSQLPKPGVIH